MPHEFHEGHRAASNISGKGGGRHAPKGTLDRHLAYLGLNLGDLERKS